MLEVKWDLQGLPSHWFMFSHVHVNAMCLSVCLHLLSLSLFSAAVREVVFAF